MKRLQIAVCLESLGLPLRRGLQEIERMGVTGVQVDAAGDLSPRNLSQTGRREFLHLLRAHNLELAALGCPLRHGLDTAEGQDGRLEHVRKVLTLSYDLGARRVVIQAGRIPEEADSPRARLMTEALLILGQHGDWTGTFLALEAGLDAAETLRDFLNRLDTGALGVNFDAANFLMNGFDPYESARALQGRIIYVQGRDARRAAASPAGQEVPLGHGDIDWMHYLAMLEEVEYRGWISVKRETGDNRLGGVAAGVKFLRRFVGGSETG